MHLGSGLGVSVSKLCESEWVGDMCVVCMCECMVGVWGGGLKLESEWWVVE